MKLYFHGGAESVTGSNYLLEVGDERVLIDCGLIQGSKEAEKANEEPFGYDPRTIQAVVLTHAHLDHVGRLPRLCKEGFSGDIYATHPTLDLARIVLDDSLYIMRENAGRGGPEPLFSEEDLVTCWKQTHGRNYKKEIQLTPSIRAVLHDAGHILGSSIVEIIATEKDREVRIVFSGDLGNAPTPFLKPTEYLTNADYVLVESVYGDRIHEGRDERRAKLLTTIEETVKKGGVLMIPSFAIERTQEILYELHKLEEAGKVPSVPIFLDSPMAIRATTVYRNYQDYLNKEAQTHIEKYDHDLFDFPGLEFTLSTEASKKINNVASPKVIIAGSGMSTGGRIVHHERRYLSDPNSTLLIIGYQTYGTLGRRLLEGASEVKMFGERVQVKARVKAIGGYSAHADQAALLKWVDSFDKKRLTRVFAVQGEPKPALSLTLKIRNELGIAAEVPEPGEVVEL